MKTALVLPLLICATLGAQIPAPPTALPSHPFFIKKTWIIGGQGNWDYLAMDAKAARLYIAHGPEVQVVDVESGNLLGAVKGLQQARSIALDETGEFGYVSDSPADQVAVFDRRTLKILATIPTGFAPRAIALDPASSLLVAVCSATAPEAAPPSPRPPATQRRPNRPPPRPAPSNPPAHENPKSVLSIIDTETRTELARITLDGRVSYGQADGRGAVYLAVQNRNEIDRLDLESLGAGLHRPPANATPAGEAQSNAGAKMPATSTEPASGPHPQDLDWSDPTRSGPTDLRSFRLPDSCREPRALAIDSKNQRLFTACNNLRMAVLNTNNGDTVTTLGIGPGVDAVGYDSDRGYIYSANGGAQGSLTVIRQDVTDSYNVIQTLATREQARTLAVDPSTGAVYLVSVIQVAKNGPPPRNGIGKLEILPEDASFQVLVVGQ